MVCEKENYYVKFPKVCVTKIKLFTSNDPELREKGLLRVQTIGGSFYVISIYTNWPFLMFTGKEQEALISTPQENNL